jgi:hypothetical protein
MCTGKVSGVCPDRRWRLEDGSSEDGSSTADDAEMMSFEIGLV